jgi:DNA processing protein
MSPLDEREAYIALNMMADIGPISVKALISALSSPQAIFKATRKELLSVEGIGKTTAERICAQRNQIQISQELKHADKLKASIVTPADDNYPEPLRAIHDPPLALYVLGKLERSDKQSIAVVGTRHATFYGRESAERLAYQLALTGFVIISGLARGIDSAAHRGALKAKGRTIAVLGSALDCIYPKENIALAKDISEHGAVLSEFPLGKMPDKTTFPMRNRIISGLAMGVLVVEAGEISGAHITASQALDQGRSVFAVPGRIDSFASRGTHRLIRDGAKLVENVDDILEEFEYLLPHKRLQQQPAFPQKLSAEEERVVNTLQEGELDIDSLIRLTAIPASTMSSLVIRLEMKKIVRLLPGQQVALIRQP